jgi:hypothetical protein
MMPPDLGGWPSDEPAALELGLDLALSLVGDHTQHFDGKHGSLLVVGYADIVALVHDRTSHE